MSSVFWGPNLAKFGLENYDFDRDKGYFMEKNDPNLPDFKEKIFQILKDKFQYVAKNIERLFFLKNFISNR